MYYMNRFLLVMMMPMSVLAGSLGEGLNCPFLKWTTGGTPSQSHPDENVNWSYDTSDSFSDGACVRSGVGGAGDAVSWLKTTIVGPCAISYSYKIQTYYGSFTVTCGDVVLHSFNADTGKEVSWQSVKYDIPSGVHELKFEYHHPGRGYVDGLNGVRIDNFVVTYQLDATYKYDGNGHTINTQAIDAARMPGSQQNFSFSLTGEGLWQEQPFVYTNVGEHVMWYKFSVDGCVEYTNQTRVTILESPNVENVTARPRYPWNGLVDIKFTLTGAEGTPSYVSFMAKDVAGGTNLTMKTLYKSDGAAANVAKEQLLPGTYNWVWDATADLTTRWVAYASCVPASSTVLFKDTQLVAIGEFYAVPCGNAINDKSNRAKGRWIKDDGAGKSVQFACSDGEYTKCVCVHFEQSGSDVIGYVKWARYVSGTGYEEEDFDANSATTQTIATSETASGYGLHKLEARVSQPDPSVVLDRVVVEGAVKDNYPLYMVIDLSGGSNATSYPVSYLDAVPGGKWSDDYKTKKLALRRVDSGSYKMNGSYSVTLTKAFYIGVFEITIEQYKLITGGVPPGYIYTVKSDTQSAIKVSYTTIRGSSNGSKWPTSDAVDSGSVMGMLRARTKLHLDIPTEAQWEYACRAGTTSLYCNGGSTDSDLYKVGICANNNYWAGQNYWGSPVGTLSPNNWGIYDMHGNAKEWCLDWCGTLTGGTDPKGPASGTSRVMRGGSYYNTTPSKCSSNARQAVLPGDDTFVNGFRISLTLE